MDTLIINGMCMVGLGAIAMALAIHRARHIPARLHDRAMRSAWSALLALMVAFVVGYVAVLVLLGSGVEDLLIPLVGLIFFAGGIFVYVVSLVTDSTIAALQEARTQERVAHKAAADALVQRNAALEASVQKSNFLANMSHELRTPLNAIIGYSELAAEELGELDHPELVADQRRVETAGRHLLTLINDILDLSKIEAGRMDISCEPFDGDHLIEQVRSTVELLASANDNTFTVELEAPVGDVVGDSLRLKQCLLNLLSNACKFTQDGQVRLIATRQGRRVRFDVVDTGIGMSEAQLGLVFEAFSQADQSTTRRFGGTGLGLTLTRRFAAMMGGELLVKSELGVGTTFTLVVPDNRHVTPIGGPATVVTASGPEDAPTILVIDDDPVAGQLVFRSAPGRIRVVTSRSGHQGVEIARSEAPVMIVLDLLIPDLSGWLVLQQLKADPATADIPVILSSVLDEGSLGMAEGATEFLAKPVDRRRLVDLVHRIIGDGSGHILVVEDDPSSRELTVRTLERQGFATATADNGQVGLDRMRERRPDLVFLDLMMPHMDGLTMLQHLQADPELRDVPVVVLTAQELSDADQLHLSTMARTVLQKGACNQTRLVDEVRRHLSQVRAGSP